MSTLLALEVAVDALFDQVPVLARPRTVTELPGGLTNRNFKIINNNGAFVARVASEGGELLAIDRENEYGNSVRAAQAGVGAPVVDYRPGGQGVPGVLVLGYIDGVTLTNAGVADRIPGIAAACRRLHGAERFDRDFDMFEIQRGYRAVAGERGIAIPDGYDDLSPAFDAARSALAVRFEGTVPCNNDLLAANFIDDGQRIWLIDYEYSGNNDPCFELGNIWAECQLSDEGLEYLVTQYYGRRRPGTVARAMLLGLAGKYGWTLWGAIQAAVSPIEFDFWSWAMERYEGAMAGFTGRGFTRLLDLAAQDD